ncbi:MAG: sodium/proline symporter [Gemmatimonadota bacterium]
MAGTAVYSAILVVYFLVLLGAGLWFNRRQGSRQEYFLARGKLGPATVGFSYSATQMSGSSYMGAVGTERVLGYNFSPGGVSSAAAAWFTYVLVGERLRRVSDRVRLTTLVDVFEARYYGRRIGGLATAIMLIAFIPLIAAQLKAASNVFEVLLGLPYLTGLFLFGGIVILYTVVGGMHAVAWTDLVQGTIMVLGFALLAPVAVSRAGGFAEMHLRYAALNPEGIHFLGGMPALWVVSSFLVWGFFQIGGAPAAVTRFLIPDDADTLRRALVYSIGFSSFVFVCGTLIAIASGVLLPELDRPDLALPTLVSMLLPPALGGLIVAAVLGATMSTIDSVLLLASSLVVENLVVPLSRRAIDTERGVRIARLSTLALGLAAVLVAIDPPATIFWIVTMAFSLMASAFTFPLLLGLWWPRATQAGALAGMTGGALACVGWYGLGYLTTGSFENWVGGIWPALFGPALSLGLMVVVSRLSPPPPQTVLDLFFSESAPTGP